MRISIKNFMPNLWMDLMWIYSTNRNPLIWKHRLRTWRKRAISNRTSNGSTDWAISSRLKYARWVEQVQIQLFISIHTNIDTREAIEKKRKRIIASRFPASKKETTSPSDWVLDRNSPWVLQHRQFQLPDGDHRWFEHITDISSEENGKSHVISII